MLGLANIFQPLIDIFEPALKFFHNTLGVSWGWSIVLLTVVIRALLLPLAFHQFRSMQKLQHVAPELKAIQAKYRDDEQRQQQDIMKFYRENDINPFASFLLLVAQIPVFIGLFYTLQTRLREDICPAVQAAFREHYAAIHNLPLKAVAGQTTACGPHNGAGFLFIHDITTKGTGLTLVVLIVLYVGTQLASTLMMSTPTMDPTQRRLMMMLPLFFVIFIVHFPAGLIVYWITTNAWTMLQQHVIRRRVRPLTPVTPAITAGGAGGGGGIDGKGPAEPASNGDGAGGLGGLLRGATKPSSNEEPSGVGAANRPRRDAPPPRPPRKKKKGAGRRR